MRVAIELRYGYDEACKPRAVYYRRVLFSIGGFQAVIDKNGFPGVPCSQP